MIVREGKQNDAVTFAVIGVLILIIISLVLTLFNKGFNILPQWLIESIVLGTFTLTGAALGAYLAGKFASKTTQQYFENNNELVEREKMDKDKIALKTALHFVSELHLTILLKVARFRNNIENYELHEVQRELRILMETAMRFESMIFDTQYLININSDNSRSVFSRLSMQLSLLKDTIRTIENLKETSNPNFIEVVIERFDKMALQLQQSREVIEKILEE